MLLFMVLALVIVLRKPDALLQPQFWAEEGFFYPKAYQYGPAALLISHSGYFQTLSQLTAVVSLLFPFKYVPLFFNLVALFFHALPVMLILGSKKILPNVKSWQRGLFVLLFLLLPNIGEIYLNLTNAQWFLAVSGALILFSEKPTEKITRWFYLFILALSCLSGPFALMFAPLTIFSYKKADSWGKTTTWIVVGGAVIQVITLLGSGGSQRTFSVFEQSPSALFTMIKNQIIWGALIGESGLNVIRTRLPLAEFFLSVGTVLGLTSIGYAIYKSTTLVRKFILWGVITFLTGLLTPTVTLLPGQQLWEVLSVTYDIRYWLIPMFVFLLCVILNLSSTHRFFRYTGIFLLGISFLFHARNIIHPTRWQYPPYEDLEFESYVEQFRQLPSGETLSIPINPKGWQMRITKKD